MERLRSHGITRDPDLMTHETDGPWYYQQLELGWNYRMTEMQAALGLSQLDRLDYFVERRRAIATNYDKQLVDCPISLPRRQAGAESSWHLYVIRLENPDTRRLVFEALQSAGLGVNVHYIPIHLHPYYAGLGFGAGDFPMAEDFYARAISIPLHPGLEPVEQQKVIAAVRDAVT